ncbi:MAG: carotenoid biosynthesis protein [Promethearchaeota archaeon]
MSFLEFFPSLIGFILCALAIIHALFDARENRLQRFLMLLTLFFYGTWLEFMGVMTKNYYYAPEIIMILEVVPLSVTLAWVGIIYSVMIIGERLKLSSWQRILTTTLIALSLDWGMDPIAVELGLWTWLFEGGTYFGIPAFNFIGWFFIPISYLIPYGLSWSREHKRPRLLSVSEIDGDRSLSRKLYTCLLVAPIGAVFLTMVGFGTLIFNLYDLHLIILVIWLIFTILVATGVIIWKRENLKRVKLFDLIPPTILLIIGYSYAILGFSISRFDLGLLMLFTLAPLLLAFIFTLRKKRE